MAAQSTAGVVATAATRGGLSPKRGTSGANAGAGAGVRTHERAPRLAYLAALSALGLRLVRGTLDALQRRRGRRARAVREEPLRVGVMGCANISHKNVRYRRPF